jgi:mono/diheme cytochrome c family protein
MRGDRRTKLCLALLPAPLILGAGVLVSAAAPAGSGKPAPAARDPKSLLAKEAVGILQQNCALCHTGEKPMGDLRLSTREDLLKGGHSGPAVALDKGDTSLLLKAVNYQGRHMPPSGKLPQKQIDTLTRWVKQGMPWPAAFGTTPAAAHHGPPPVNARTKKFWSFQPVKRPAVPTAKNRTWVRSPIDAFVLSRLESEGLGPNPPASRAALIRRATYDLTGLPPSPEEVRAFLADRSPNAWEKVVDRLLASPQYGEKWGRHWLDLVRFAETNSYERDGVKPNAWRYRDYVINAFNQDKPYHQFVLEQLAGDELPGRTPEHLIATGYYRLGLWDDEPVDPKQALYDDLDDIVSTTGQVFLGLTVGCARCHDHKIDPIAQKDYYRFLAFFSGVRRYGGRGEGESVEEFSLRPIVAEAEARRYQSARREYRAKLRRNQQGIGAVERRVYEDLTPVEKEDWQHEENRPRLVKARVPKLLTREEYDRYQALLVEKKALVDGAPPEIATALAVTEEKQPRPTHVLMRGNPHAEGEPVQPGFPLVLSPPSPVIAPTPYGDSSGRRLALARWITSPGNPLSARVMANRIWQFHFGRGVVRTTSDFGFQGSKPTHPQLLDWLASDLVAKSWRLKPFHRTIMLSSTYQMSSRPNPKALAKDPENDLLWRFDMRRLQAEEVRDSILAANGSLNPKMGGPGIYPTMPKEVLAGQSMPGAGWGKSSPAEQCRRSVYIHVKRSLITPIIASFDGPETDFTCPVRFATTQPTQALGMMNSTFINEQAHILADYLRKHAGATPAAQVRLALWRVTQRQPGQKEIDRGIQMMARLQQQHKTSADEALVRFCTVALNLNEFLYLD